MKRRKFIQNSIGLSVLTSLSEFATAKESVKQQIHQSNYEFL